MAEKNKRARSSNFSTEEMNVLAAEVTRRKSILFADFSSKVTHVMKQAEWDAVKSAVDAVSIAPRSIDSLKDKWNNVKRSAKAKLASNRREMAKTGGGSASLQQLTPSEEDAAGTIGIESLEGLSSIDYDNLDATDMDNSTVTGDANLDEILNRPTTSKALDLTRRRHLEPTTPDRPPIRTRRLTESDSTRHSQHTDIQSPSVIQPTRRQRHTSQTITENTPNQPKLTRASMQMTVTDSMTDQTNLLETQNDLLGTQNTILGTQNNILNQLADIHRQNNIHTQRIIEQNNDILIHNDRIVQQNDERNNLLTRLCDILQHRP